MSAVESWLLDRIPERGELALDIGANEGTYTQLFARRFQQVDAFEPNPQVTPALRRNLAGLSNARLIEAAVTRTSGRVTLHLFAQHEHASSYVESELATAPRGDVLETIEVPAVSLDDLAYHWVPVDLIKLDVEGAEAAVLNGARRTIGARRPHVLVEIHSADTLDCCVHMLEAAELTVEHIPHPHEGVSPGHCWLAARGRD